MPAIRKNPSGSVSFFPKIKSKRYSRSQREYLFYIFSGSFARRFLRSIVFQRYFYGRIVIICAFE